MTVTCLNCGGRGWIARIMGNGYKRPVLCQGCGGSGKQDVLDPGKRCEEGL